MIVLDTNVISEMMRPRERRDGRVLAWLDERPREALFTTVFNVAEIFYGVESLPDGRRREALATEADAVLREAFEDRVLDFGEVAARRYASMAAARRRAGRHLDVIDTLIAATASAQGFAVATRNAEDYRLLGVPVINPWAAP